MARGKRKTPSVDDVIEEVYSRHGENVQISVLDIGKIFNAGRRAALDGKSIEAAVIAAIAQYRQN
jgi:hypothetical protein